MNERIHPEAQRRGSIENRANAKRRSSLARRWAAIGALVLTGAFSWVAAETTHRTTAQATVTQSTPAPVATAAPSLTTTQTTTAQSLQSSNTAPSAAGGNAVATSGAS